GSRTGRSVTPRNILISNSGLEYVQGVIDSANAYDGSNTSYEDELRVGLVMARITSSKKWVPCKRTTVLSGGGTVTTCVLTDARTFKVGDTITINGDAITITAINYTTNAITWVGAQTIVNAEVVIAASGLAGAEIPRAILNEFIKLKDEDATWRDKSFSLGLIRGFVDNSLILGDLTAIRAATNYLGSVLWADQQGYN
ncbi:MAG: hypothetical protein V4587_17855, partial [Acidobacteriota bacterium]